jgi:hypothetical protein
LHVLSGKHPEIRMPEEYNRANLPSFRRTARACSGGSFICVSLRTAEAGSDIAYALLCGYRRILVVAAAVAMGAYAAGSGIFKGSPRGIKTEKNETLM